MAFSSLYGGRATSLSSRSIRLEALRGKSSLGAPSSSSQRFQCWFISSSTSRLARWGRFRNRQWPKLSSFCLLASHSPISRSEEHTSELQSRPHLVCRLLLEKK